MATTRISVLQASGEVIVLEVTAETTGCELKQQIKDMQPWDELTRKTTVVEIILEDNTLLANDAKVLDAGIAGVSAVSVVFKPNLFISSNQKALRSRGSVIDRELLLVVEVPSGQTQICTYAFTGCDTIAKLTIPDSVTDIGDFAFHGCRSLANLTIPDSVIHIGVGAFADCHALVDLTMPDSVTHLGEFVFVNCSSLVSLIIPDSVSHIGDHAFHGCSSSANLTIPESLTHVGYGSFMGCSGIELN